MPTNNVNYPITYSCIFNDSYTRSACPPIRVDCQPINTCGWFITAPTEAWSCNLCGSDEAFCMPYVLGDKIPIQVNFPDFVNSFPSPLTAGWQGDTIPATIRAQLLDVDGVVISSDVTAFCSDYVVGYNDGEPYQTIIVDTSLVDGLGEQCFSIRINNFLSDTTTEDKVIYTEPFCQLPVNCSIKTVLIEGTFNNYDCMGFYYGTAQRTGPAFTAFIGSSDFAYYNTMRYYGELQDTGGAVSKNVFGTANIVTRSTLLQNYRLQLTAKVPPYIMQTFLKQHFIGQTFKIDGEEYIASGNVTNQISSRLTNMFLFNVTVQKECDTRFGCD